MTSEAEKYLKFLQKFEVKKTTDDCYTPPNIYNAVLDWAKEEYNLQDREIIRPFHPEGDYQKYKYPDNSVVLDNPPFSILSEIVKWYEWKEIDYFLFAPNLTLFSPDAKCSIVADADIIYTNGAKVRTSFLTNLDRAKIRTAPKLGKAIKAANAENLAKQARQLPRYTYPDNVVSAAHLNKIANVELKIMPEECSELVKALEHQKRHGKKIFGTGYIVSDKVAAEIRAAEIKAAEIKTAEVVERITWKLEGEELGILKRLNNGEALAGQDELF